MPICMVGDQLADLKRCVRLGLLYMYESRPGRDDMRFFSSATPDQLNGHASEYMRSNYSTIACSFVQGQDER